MNKNVMNKTPSTPKYNNQYGNMNKSIKNDSSNSQINLNNINQENINNNDKNDIY